MPLGLTPLHLVIILVIVLIVVGPGKLPSMGKALGESIREFRKSVTDVREAVSLDPPDGQAPTATPVPPVVSAPVVAAPAVAAPAEVPPIVAAPVVAPLAAAAPVASATATPAAPMNMKPANDVKV